MANGAYDYRPATGTPQVFTLDNPSTPAEPSSTPKARTIVPSAPLTDEDVAHAPAIEAAAPEYTLPEAAGNPAVSSAPRFKSAPASLPAPVEATTVEAEPPLVRTAPIQRPPAIVPAPERPLYTTEVTFTTPATQEKGIPAEPPIIGAPAEAAPRRDAVADPYTESTGPGYGGGKAKKKIDSSLEAPRERRPGRSRSLR